MTHEEARPRLGAYAAGALDDLVSEGVRAHLASGCSECLQDLFVRPVGLPRQTNGVERGPVPAPSSSQSRGLVVAVVALAAALATAVGWMALELRARRAAHRNQEARAARELAEAERARVALVERLAVVDRELADLRAAPAPPAEPVPADEHAERQEELDQAEGRVAMLGETLRRREREIGRLRAALAGDETIRAAVEAPDLELLRLAPGAPFRDVRGHALWHPGADRVVVYAYGLPPLSEAARYRIEVALADGRLVVGPAFTVGPGGEATVPVPVEGGRVSPRELRLTLEPGGRLVLGWRRPAD
jgi:hypothetical protein